MFTKLWKATSILLACITDQILKDFQNTAIVKMGHFQFSRDLTNSYKLDTYVQLHTVGTR